MPKRKNTSDRPEPVKWPRVGPGDGRSIGRTAEQHSTSSSRPTTAQQLGQVDGLGASKSRSQRKSKGDGRLDAPVALNAGHSSRRRENIHKLAPPRPFPTVSSSVSASGPKSAHTEGKNLICITRHTPLAAYLSRCKKLLVEEGYQTLHLHAMGAAIPHLLTLSVSLPPILPFARDEVKLEVRTGTIEVMDEIVPENEDEDMSLRTRGKGGVSVMIQIQGGDTLLAGAQKPQTASRFKGKGKEREIVVVQEQDQEDNGMDQDGEDGEVEN